MKTNQVRIQPLLDLLQASAIAADWLSRSARIDDREQAEDLRKAIDQAVAYRDAYARDLKIELINANWNRYVSIIERDAKATGEQP